MSLNPWILLIALSATVASFAQVLLKKSAGEKLVSLALERGAPDNVTVLLLRQ